MWAFISCILEWSTNTECFSNLCDSLKHNCEMFHEAENVPVNSGETGLKRSTYKWNMTTHLTTAPARQGLTDIFTPALSTPNIASIGCSENFHGPHSVATPYPPPVSPGKSRLPLGHSVSPTSRLRRRAELSTDVSQVLVVIYGWRSDGMTAADPAATTDDYCYCHASTILRQ